MKIAGDDYPDLNIGDEFWIAGVDLDDFNDYKIRYKIVDHGRYELVYNSNSFYSDSVGTVYTDSDICFDVEQTYYGIQLGEEKDIKIEP